MYTTEVINSFQHRYAIDDVVRWLDGSQGRTYRIINVNPPRDGGESPDAVRYDLECITGGSEFIGKEFLNCLLRPDYVELVDDPTYTYTITVKQYGDGALHNITLGAEGIKEYMEKSHYLRVPGSRYEVVVSNDCDAEADESFTLRR